MLGITSNKNYGIIREFFHTGEVISDHRNFFWIDTLPVSTDHPSHIMIIVPRWNPINFDLRIAVETMLIVATHTRAVHQRSKWWIGATHSWKYWFLFQEPKCPSILLKFVRTKQILAKIIQFCKQIHNFEYFPEFSELLWNSPVNKTKLG